MSERKDAPAGSAHLNVINLAVLSDLLCKWHAAVNGPRDAEQLALAYREMVALAEVIADELELTQPERA